MNIEQMMKAAGDATDILKALSHEHRLLTLCFIDEGEKTVREIEEFLKISQSSVSQLLGKLKDKGIVTTRRDGKNIYYRVKNIDVLQLIATLQNIFCPKPKIVTKT